VFVRKYDFFNTCKPDGLSLLLKLPGTESGLRPYPGMNIPESRRISPDSSAGIYRDVANILLPITLICGVIHEFN
jgi:hypothetical protein